MLNPGLIPRFNLDYNFHEMVYGLNSTFSNENTKSSQLNLIFGNKNFFFTNSGRTSLYIILKSLKLPNNSFVGVPLFSCVSVFDAILKAGYKPLFIDINLNDYTIDTIDLEKKIHELSALVIIHTFGYPANMDTIQKIANNMPIIEDCAHALLSEYKGEKTGTIGTASFFSFRSAKYISAGEGSMIILNDEKLADSFNYELKKLHSHNLLNEVKHTILTYIKSVLYHKPLYGSFALPVGMLIENNIDLMSKKGFSLFTIRKCDLGIFLKRINRFKENIDQQRMNSKFLIEKLQGTKLKLLVETKDVYCNYYLFPLRFNSKLHRDKSSIILKSMGIDSAKLFSNTPAIAKRNYNYLGDCPNTEICCLTLLTIPNYYTLKFQDLSKILVSLRRTEKLVGL